MPLGTPGQGRRTFEVKRRAPDGDQRWAGCLWTRRTALFWAWTSCWRRRDLGSVFLDFHAEATSEKAALGWYLDGRVAAVIGTHTHVPTADTRILPRGTAFQTDAGFTGPMHSIIGADPEGPLQRFLTERPHRFGVNDGPAELNGVWLGHRRQCRTQHRALPLRRHTTA